MDMGPFARLRYAEFRAGSGTLSAARVYLAGRSEKRKYSPQLGDHLGEIPDTAKSWEGNAVPRSK